MLYTNSIPKGGEYMFERVVVVAVAIFIALLAGGVIHLLVGVPVLSALVAVCGGLSGLFMGAACALSGRISDTEDRLE